MRRPSVCQCVLFALCITLLIPTSSIAQSPTFALEGVVTDAQQATLPGVAVTVTNTATGLTRTVTTGENGRCDWSGPRRAAISRCCARS